jgi:hypothetical protein
MACETRASVISETNFHETSTVLGWQNLREIAHAKPSWRVEKCAEQEAWLSNCPWRHFKAEYLGRLHFDHQLIKDPRKDI